MSQQIGVSRDAGYSSRDPSKIPTVYIHEIIVRFLINLPPEEKKFPRVMNTIKDCCWFYVDQFCNPKPDVDNTYFKKFAQRIMKHWSYLKPYVGQFSQLWEEYRLYKSQIPSYGALIFNKTLDSLLFVIYHNPRDRIVKKLDFPKGKVDQGERPKDCALREIYEETQLRLHDQLNVDSFVKVETIKHRMVTLYLVEGIMENSVQAKPQLNEEDHYLKWIPVAEYIQETLKQNTIDSVLSNNANTTKYCAYYVKRFAYFVSEWQTMRRTGKLKIKDSYKRISVHDQDLLTESSISKECIRNLCQSSKEFSSLLKELPFFMHGFFHHQVLNDFQKAKKLYKEALKRTEFTKGCYSMLASIYIVESMQSREQGAATRLLQGKSDNEIDLGYLEAKLNSLEDKYGHFLRYEKSLTGLKDRIIQSMREQVMADVRMQPSKQILVVEINKFYKSSNYGDNMSKLNDFASQFKAKFLTAKILKFDPFALKNTIVAWPKNSNSFLFYKHKFPAQFIYQTHSHHHNNRQNNGGKVQMIEHAIIEVGSERKAYSLRSLINNKGPQSGVYCELVNQYQITVDEFPFIPIRSIKPSIPVNQQPPLIVNASHHEISLQLTSPMHSNHVFIPPPPQFVMTPLAHNTQTANSFTNATTTMQGQFFTPGGPLPLMQQQAPTQGWLYDQDSAILQSEGGCGNINNEAHQLLTKSLRSGRKQIAGSVIGQEEDKEFKNFMKQIDGEFGAAAENLNNPSDVEEEGSCEAEQVALIDEDSGSSDTQQFNVKAEVEKLMECLKNTIPVPLSLIEEHNSYRQRPLHNRMHTHLKPPRLNRIFKSERFSQQDHRYQSTEPRRLQLFDFSHRGLVHRQKSESRGRLLRDSIDLNVAPTFEKAKSRQQKQNNQLAQSNQESVFKEANGQQSPSGVYVVKQTNQNLKAYQEYRQQAKAIWNANNEQRSPRRVADKSLAEIQPPSFDRLSTIDQDQAAAASFFLEGLRLAKKESVVEQRASPGEDSSLLDRSTSTQDELVEQRVKVNVDALIDRIKKQATPPDSKLQHFSQERHQKRRRAKLIKYLDNEMDDEFFFGEAIHAPLTTNKIPEIDEQGYEEEEEDRQPETIFGQCAQSLVKRDQIMSHIPKNISFIMQGSSMNMQRIQNFGDTGPLLQQHRSTNMTMFQENRYRRESQFRSQIWSLQQEQQLNSMHHDNSWRPHQNNGAFQENESPVQELN